MDHVHEKIGMVTERLKDIRATVRDICFNCFIALFVSILVLIYVQEEL